MIHFSGLTRMSSICRCYFGRAFYKIGKTKIERPPIGRLLRLYSVGRHHCMINKCIAEAAANSSTRAGLASVSAKFLHKAITRHHKVPAASIADCMRRDGLIKYLATGSAASAE